MLSRRCTVLIVGLLLPLTASAQDDSLRGFRLGAGLGAEFGRGGGILPVYQGAPDCGQYDGGSASAVVPSIAYSVPELFGGGLGIMLRLSWRSLAMTAEARPIDPQRAVDPATLELVDVDRRFALESDLSALSAAVALRYSLGALSIVAGPRATMWLAATAAARDRIAGPAFAQHRDGSTDRELAGAWMPEPRPLGFGFLAELGYDVALADGLWVVPRLGGQLDVPGPIDGNDWTIVSATVSVGVEWSPSRSPEPPPPVVVAVTPEPALRLSLTAIDSAGREHDTLVIRTERVIERRSAPLVPAVFFDRDAAELPLRYVRRDGERISAGETFGAASDALTAQLQILNIVGQRMAGDSAARLTLVGSVSTEESAQLASARAEAVRAYLQHAWSIAPSRIAVSDRGEMPRSSEATEQGREENRRVEFVSTSPTLLAPVESDSIIERRTSAALRVRGAIEGPFREWTASVLVPGSDPVELGHGDSSARTVSADLRLDAPDVAALRRGDALTAEIRATTVSGAPRVLVETLPVDVTQQQTLVEGWATRTAEREVLQYSVLGFGYDSPSLIERHRRQLAIIARRIRPGAQIAVTGYSDRLGDETRNLELSEERARSVGEYLRSAAIADVATQVRERGAGVDASRFPNELPEGRMLSRGVTVVIEQDIGP